MKLKLNDSSFILEKDNTEIDVLEKLNNPPKQSLLIEVTYYQLKALINNNNLVPGYKYKIIDLFNNDEEWIDLGLPSGNLWCSHNLRGNSFNDGLYYAWGETTGYVDAAARNVALGLSRGFDIEAYTQTGGSLITDDVLLPEHDAATLYYGENVVIPTADDFLELINPKYTTVEFIENGALITSKINGNNIFLKRNAIIVGESEQKSDDITFLTSNKFSTTYAVTAILDEGYYTHTSSNEKHIGYKIRPIKKSNKSLNDKSIICTALSTNQLSEHCKLIKDNITSLIKVYKTDIEDYPDEVDYNDYYKYTETVEFDGKTYYKWNKYEYDEEVGYSILTSVLYKPGDLSLDNWSEDYIKLLNDEEYKLGEEEEDKLVLVAGDIIDSNNYELEVGYCINNDTERFPWCNPNGKGVIYATKKLFYDSEVKAVDLGLPSGTLWADRNIGADKSEDYGQYFMHGDVEGYNEDDGIKCTGSYSNNKWDGLYGCVKGAYYPYNANNPDIPIAFDAARKKVGNEWEMPTEDQLNELLNNDYTTKSFEEFNGVYGLLITSKENNNSIFLPAAGYISSTGIGGRTTSGCYWSKKLISQTTAVMLDFDSGGNSTSSQSRQYGCNIRAVYKP